jgi:hypothetical protein
MAELLGKEFGYWVVKEFAGKLLVGSASKQKHPFWSCECKGCGKKSIIRQTSLLYSNNKGCANCRNRDSKRKQFPPHRKTYHRLVFDATKRNLAVDFTYEQYLSEFVYKYKYCHYCENEISWDAYNPSCRHNLDRKNNSLGYSLENCVPCCAVCNRAKGNLFTYEEWHSTTKTPEYRTAVLRILTEKE